MLEKVCMCTLVECQKKNKCMRLGRAGARDVKNEFIFNYILEVFGALRALYSVQTDELSRVFSE